MGVTYLLSELQDAGKQMTLNVHILDSDADELVGLMKPLLSGETAVTHGPIDGGTPSFDILISGVPSATDITHSDRLHTLIIPWSGLPTSTRKLMLQYPNIAVHNIHHNAPVVAEMAFTLMLTAMKKIVPLDRDLRANDWRPRYAPPQSGLLSGKRVLILGYGAIGRLIARHCAGFDVRIIGVRSSGKHRTEDNVEIYGRADLAELLPRADVLFVTLPHTEDSRGLIGTHELAMLPDGAVVVNVARGPVIDQRALYEELRSGRISAGLDVWYDYPDTVESRENTAPSEFPFGELDNVVMTPHLAGHAHETERLRAKALAKLLNAAACGEALSNRVDLERGY